MSQRKLTKTTIRRQITLSHGYFGLEPTLESWQKARWPNWWCNRQQQHTVYFSLAAIGWIHITYKK